MNTHKNARLTFEGRKLLIQRIALLGLKAAASASVIDARTSHPPESPANRITGMPADITCPGSPIRSTTTPGPGATTSAWRRCHR